MKNYLLNPRNRRKRSLLLYDALVVLGVFLVSYGLRVFLHEGRGFEELLGRVSWLVILGVLVHLMSFYAFGLYEQDVSANLKILFVNILLSILVASGGVAILSFVFPAYKIGRTLVGIHMFLMVTAVYFWRMLYGLWGEQEEEKKVIIAGWDSIAQKIVDLLLHTKAGYDVESIVVEKGQPRPEGIGNLVPVYESLEEAFKWYRPDTLVLSPVPKDFGIFGNFLLDLKFEGAEVYTGPGFYERISGRVPVSEIQDRWLLLGGSSSAFQPMVYPHLKRLMDLTGSGLALLLSFPVCLLVALLIKLSSKGPVLFRQERLGQYERPFMLLKFRTMVDNAEKASGPCWATESDPRVTRIGRFLRKTRLDELPQFMNVLKGDISLVGPRPIREYFADQFIQKFPFYRLRFKVRPGITGWAQVNMPYVNTEEDQYEKLEYEMYYVYHQSIFLDLFILLKTVQAVIKMKGN
jgi:exopolysaccharide biosynthesis polyprenyl glycosylphosphotransferase